MGDGRLICLGGNCDEKQIEVGDGKRSKNTGNAKGCSED